MRFPRQPHVGTGPTPARGCGITTRRGERLRPHRALFVQPLVVNNYSGSVGLLSAAPQRQASAYRHQSAEYLGLVFVRLGFFLLCAHSRFLPTK